MSLFPINSSSFQSFSGAQETPQSDPIQEPGYPTLNQYAFVGEGFSSALTVIRPNSTQISTTSYQLPEPSAPSLSADDPEHAPDHPSPSNTFPAMGLPISNPQSFSLTYPCHPQYPFSSLSQTPEPNVPSPSPFAKHSDDVPVYPPSAGFNSDGSQISNREVSPNASSLEETLDNLSVLNSTDPLRSVPPTDRPNYPPVIQRPGYVSPPPHCRRQKTVSETSSDGFSLWNLFSFGKKTKPIQDPIKKDQVKLEEIDPRFMLDVKNMRQNVDRASLRELNSHLETVQSAVKSFEPRGQYSKVANVDLYLQELRELKLRIFNRARVVS